MDLALYAPGLGYYSAGAAKFGEAGDFVTAPEISPLFSRCLAGQCAQVLADIDGGVVLELGAGTGVMAADLLLELDRLGSLPATYYILEPSADLRERQRSLLGERAGALVERVEWLQEGPAESLRGMILANEVVDALPVNRFYIEGDQVGEVGVVAEKGQFLLQPRPAGGSLRTALEPVRSLADFDAGEGYMSEVSLRVPAWLNTLSGWLEHGIVLLFDYGHSRAEYYLPERNAGTLRCYYRHRVHDDPLLWPGLQDISAWVDFSLLAHSAEEAGLDVLGYTTQAQFLLAAGLNELIAGQEAVDEQAQVALSRGLRQLLMPGEMGESVKVLALGRGEVAIPEGMKGRDMRASL
jgi:SAM-dependent MidA family methyltransferase